MNIIDNIVSLDTDLFLALNSLHSDFMDPVMWVISGKLTWLPLYLAYAVFLFYKHPWKQALVMFLASVVAVALADFVSVNCFKKVFCRFRPTHTDSISGLIYIVNDYRGGLYGFVSSHAANTFSFAAISSFMVRNRFFTISIFIWASIVSYSRIYLGVHFPLDIIGGAILGVLLAIGVFRLYKIVLPAKWKQS